MTQELTGTIRERLEKKSTSELRRIWVENNRQHWSQAAFDIIEDILVTRRIPIPEQDAPITRPEIKSGKQSVVIQVMMLLFMLGGLALSIHFYQHLRYFMSFLFVAVPSIVFCFFLHLRKTAIFLIVMAGIVALFACSPAMQHALYWLIGHLSAMSPTRQFMGGYA